MTFTFRMRCSSCGETYEFRNPYKPCPNCGASWQQSYAEFYDYKLKIWQYLTKPEYVEKISR